MYVTYICVVHFSTFTANKVFQNFVESQIIGDCFIVFVDNSLLNRTSRCKATATFTSNYGRRHHCESGDYNRMLCAYCVASRNFICLYPHF